MDGCGLAFEYHENSEYPNGYEGSTKLLYYKKGDELGSISDPFGKFERKVKAPNDGYVFCVNQTPIVNKGDAILHITL